MIRVALVIAGLCALMLPQSKSEPLDGPNRPLHDDLLDHLQGHWKVTGNIRAQPAEVDLTGEWVLNHQFLLMHEKGLTVPPGQPAYEVNAYVGYDNTSDRYVVHWIDIYGGRVSETLGFGTRAGNSLKLNFEYPDGPFHNTMTWDPQAKTWHFILEQKNAAGKWTLFADQTAARMK